MQVFGLVEEFGALDPIDEVAWMRLQVSEDCLVDLAVPGDGLRDLRLHLNVVIYRCRELANPCD